METLPTHSLIALRCISDVFDERDSGPINYYTVGAILSMVSEGEVLEITDEASFNYAFQKLILDKIVPIAHLIHEAFFAPPLKITAICPITMEERNSGLYLGGSTHCISLKDALHFFFKNGLRRPDGGEITEIRRVGTITHNDFVSICQPIFLQKLIDEIESRKYSAKDVADFKNATIEDVENGDIQIEEDIRYFQEQYGFQGTFCDKLRHINMENVIFEMIFT